MIGKSGGSVDVDIMFKLRGRVQGLRTQKDCLPTSQFLFYALIMHKVIPWILIWLCLALHSS